MDEELKALLEESTSDIPQDLLDGKHRFRLLFFLEILYIWLVHDFNKRVMQPSHFNVQMASRILILNFA